MANTLDLSTFRRHLQGKSIDVSKATKDSRLKGVNVARADLNGDGQIANKAEVTALFQEIRRIDRAVAVRDSMGGQTRAARAVQAVGDLAGVNILQDLARDDIMLIGMNPSGKVEANALKKNGNGVVFIGDTDDKITADGTTFDLKVQSELEAFVALLDLDKAKSKDVADAISNAGDDVRDEAAHIAWVWAPAEKGAAVPARLVISGHSVGSVFWGDNNGMLERKTVADLAKALPTAAAQVEDLHLSACYCGGKSQLEAWLLVFPGLKTIWAYSGSAPGTYEGAVSHLLLWDMATRGDKKTIDRLIAAKTRKGQYVAVWSRLHGYVDGKPPEPLSTLQARVKTNDATFDAYFVGDRTVSNTQTGELRTVYNDIQSLLQHPDLPSADRPAIERKRDVTIRLIYFDKSVKGTFAVTHKGLIESGYRALGQTPPDFAKLSRKEALQAIERFTNAAKATSSLPADAAKLRPLLESGLRDLLASHIPETWIG